MNKIQEIGSEFWDIPITTMDNDIIPYNAEWFISGRAALHSVILDIKLHNKNLNNAFLPSWCCESMIIPFLMEGFNVNFYSVYYDGNKLIQRMDMCENADVVLIMDYFGFGLDNDIELNSSIVIYDLTHSIFNMNKRNADYYIASLRKWAGFCTGGIAWRDLEKISILPDKGINEQYVEMRRVAMKTKKEYIENVHRNKDYLQMFNKAQLELVNCDLYAGTKEDYYNARYIDVNCIKNKRRENAKYLIDNLSDLVLFKSLNDNDVPLFVPIMLPAEHRDFIRDKLINNNIYCPIHWPLSKQHNLLLRDKRVYEEELSLVCDQRYSIVDMKRIKDILLESLELIG